MDIRGFVDDFLADHKAAEAQRKERNTIEHDRFDHHDFNSINNELGLMSTRTQDLARITGDPIAQHAASDSFYTFYKSEPELADKKSIRPSHLVTQFVMEEAMGLPDYDRLRMSSSMDLINSGLAYTEVEPKLEIIYDKLQEAVKASQELESMMAGYSEASDDMEALAEALAQAMADGDGDPDDLSDQLAAAREALEQMEESMRQQADAMQSNLDINSVEVKELLAEGMQDGEEQAERLDNISSWGLEPGSIHRVPPQKRIELAKRLDNEKFRKIAELIGPMTRLALTEQSRKTIFARNEIYDVIPGSDLAHTLMSEFIELDDDILFYDFVRKWMEGSLLQYELKGQEKIDRGNIIFCEDGSGSMGGAREIWAKAVSGALLTIARRQKRDFTGIHFGSPNEYMHFDFDFKGDAVKTTYSPGGYDRGFKSESFDVFDGIIHWMEIFFNSGTDFATPLTVALNMLEEQYAQNGQIDGDIVFCTDGMCNVTPEWLKQFKERQKFLGFKVWGIVIGGSGDSEPLNTICDSRVYGIQDLASGEDVRSLFQL